MLMKTMGTNWKVWFKKKIGSGVAFVPLNSHSTQWLPILMIYPETMVAGKLYCVLFQDKTIITLYLLINVCWGRIHIWQYDWQFYQWRDEHWKFKEELVLFKGGLGDYLCIMYVLYIWNVEYVALEIIWIVYLFWLIVGNRVFWGWGAVKILNYLR